MDMSSTERGDADGGRTPYYDDGTVQIHHGDSRELRGELRADVIVTDPPYQLAFMGRTWDQPTAGFHEAWATAAFQALPPGGWLLAFGGARTWHRLACGIEDAGFEIRDTLMWLYGQGFPKGKACLKPGWEPILLARKPGSSVLQIDACRIGYASQADHAQAEAGTQRMRRTLRDQKVSEGWDRPWQQERPRSESSVTPSGRWPANVVLVHSEGCQPVGVRKVRGAGWRDHDTAPSIGPVYGDDHRDKTGPHYADPDGTETVEAWDCDEDSCPVFLLDQQSGERPGATSNGKRRGSGYQGNWPGAMQAPGYADQGGSSRFFYTAKAGRSERVTVDGEQHPTVKPLALMRWLVRLVTPPGGTVLDPFCGSGSTLVAARMEGFRAIGVEADERWCKGSAQRLTEIPPIQGALL